MMQRQHAHFKPFIFVLIFIVFVCSLVGLLAGWYPRLDLFNNFRPQAVLAALILLPIACYVKDKINISFAVLVLALNLACIGQGLLAFPTMPRAAGDEKAISLAFANVLRVNQEHDKLLEVISHVKPDIVVTAEPDEAWVKALTARLAYPHSVAVPRSDNFGMAVFSTLPFTTQRYDVGTYGLPLLVLDFGSFVVMAVHPVPPLQEKSAEQFYIYMNKMQALAKEIKKPLLIAGDINTTLWSQAVHLLGGVGLQRSNPTALAWTWPSGFLPLAVQIDHIFGRDIALADFKVLPDTGSDHFPVMAQFIVPQ